EAGRILDEDWQLSDLPREGERALDDFRRGLPTGDHFDQFHPADWIKKMEADDARGRSGTGRELSDRQCGSVRRQDRGFGRVRREVSEDFLFDLELFRGGFDGDLDVA